MAVDLFSLRMNIETTGLAQARTGLESLNATGVKTANGLGTTTARMADLNIVAAQQHANIKALEQSKVRLSGTLNRLSRDVAAANTDFKAGRISAADHAVAMGFARDEATKLGSATRLNGDQLKKYNGILKDTTPVIREKTSALGALGSSLAHLALFYAGFKTVEFVHRTLDAAASLHELSQQTGVSVEMLSVLKFAGAQAGVGTEQITIGFRGMALSLGNLRDGQDKTVAAYHRLGFSVTSFKGLNPEQTFIKLATAIGGMKDETERAEVAQRVFGRAGTVLLPLLVDIAEKGFARIRQETEQSGGMFTTEMATKADKFSDSMTRLGASLKVLTVEGLTPLLPKLTLFIDGLTRAIQLMKTDPSIGRGDLWGGAAALMVGGLKAAQPHGPDPGGFRGDNLGMGTNPLDALGPGATAEEIAEAAEDAKKAAEKAQRDREAAARKAEQERQALFDKAGFGGAMWSQAPVSAPDRLGFRGLGGPVALRGGSVGPLTPTPISGGPGEDFMGGSLGGDLSALFADGGSGKSAEGRMAILAAFANEAKRNAVALKVQFAQMGQSLGMTLVGSFSDAMAAAFTGKNPFKAFGKTMIAGLGSIFGQMGKAMIAAAMPLIKLLPFLSNPLTSGPALLAAGIILTALGTALGGIATGPGGSGGGGGGDFRDRTTQITLTPVGLGGMDAPHRAVSPQLHVLGKDSPEGQRLLGEYTRAAQRSRNL